MLRTSPADLSVAEASGALGRRELSSRELVEACLARIEERDGRHSLDGDPGSINAWVRVYAEDALAAAAEADARDRRGPLDGIPIGLKDIYAVAGKPLTASSRAYDETPAEDCDVWAALKAQGMVLLGHLHTHEFAAGGTTDQVGNPWALDRSAGGSSGGSAAALAARMTPAATGTDTAGSLRIPSAFCGTSAVKPTRGLLSIRGIVPLAASLDHPGPMARTVEDCGLLLAGMAGWDEPVAALPLAGARLAVSPRTDDLDPDVAAAFEAVLELCGRLGVELVPGPPIRDTLPDWGAVFDVDMWSFHRQLADRLHLYRDSTREFAERAAGADPGRYDELQALRGREAAEWDDWFRRERVDALLEPTLPDVAWPRGPGYDHAGSDVRLIERTHTWNWTGHPVVALPAGLGARSGLPTSVSLIGASGSERRLLGLGITLQSDLGVPSPSL